MARKTYSYCVNAIESAFAGIGESVKEHLAGITGGTPGMITVNHPTFPEHQRCVLYEGNFHHSDEKALKALLRSKGDNTFDTSTVRNSAQCQQYRTIASAAEFKVAKANAERRKEADSAGDDTVSEVPTDTANEVPQA